MTWNSNAGDGRRAASRSAAKFTLSRLCVTRTIDCASYGQIASFLRQSIVGKRKMGFLTDGETYTWDELKPHIKYVKEHGIIQFLNVYNKLKDRSADTLKWGDEASACSKIAHSRSFADRISTCLFRQGKRRAEAVSSWCRDSAQTFQARAQNATRVRCATRDWVLFSLNLQSEARLAVASRVRTTHG